MQAVRPVYCMYLPLGQAAHCALLVAPACARYRPLVQTMQRLLDFHLPAAHREQSARALRYVGKAVAEVVLPEGQPLQAAAVWNLLSTYLPCGQTKQELPDLR